VDKNNNWYEGSGLLIPSTNNGLESWNRVIKDEHTLCHGIFLLWVGGWQLLPVAQSWAG
jgi:hypothetical protein